MSVIHSVSTPFHIENLHIHKPVHIQGQTIMKLSERFEPIYVQLPQGCTKSAIKQGGKKVVCDLLFDSMITDSLFEWFETIESRAVDLIYEHRDWFSTEFQKDDIEQLFTSSVKVIKSGKNYVMRLNVGEGTTVYNENEQKIGLEDIKEQTNVMSIVELVGIRCISSSFSLELNIKQLLVVKPVSLFEKCMLLRNNDVSITPITTNDVSNNNVITNEVLESSFNEAITNEAITNDVLDRTEENNDIEILEKESIAITDEPEKQFVSVEIGNPIDDSEPIIELQSRNEVHLKMYFDALEKAKLAKQLAMSAYLEAKRINEEFGLSIDMDINELTFDLSPFL